MNDPNADARAIFFEALERKSPAEMNQYLDEACRKESGLRVRVEELLRAHRNAGNFLGGPAHKGCTTDQQASDATGTVIGPYKLLQQIGEGGMGTVYMAEQTQPVVRKVALKIIKPGMDTRLVIARFEAERQALALMDHPNIAKVLDAGTAVVVSGEWRVLSNEPPSALSQHSPHATRPYFVMELVRGVPITQYCDERRLTPKQRLELFVPVCHAIQHAHQKGIIHRDLKPSNVLVAEYDDRPVPKVIDFGVAKATGPKLTERTMFTEFGQIVGTLEYMSPEQAAFNAMDIDTRSDIYALGVLLYELLTGTTPFEKKRFRQEAFDEMLRIIREEEPPRPSTRLSTTDELPSIATNRGSEPKKLSGLVRGELDWIVMKCLEKDRNRRYESANGLAMDLQRHLADEPVLACPPSATYRLRKFASKNRKLLSAVAAFVLLMAAGTVASTWQAVRATEAERQALFARDGETLQRQQAEKSAAETKAVLKFFKDNVLAAARPKAQAGGLSKDATIRDALDKAEPKIARAFSEQPIVEASIRDTLGLSYWYLAELPLARRQEERALALRRQYLGPEHPDTLGSINDLAMVVQAQGRNEEATKLFEEVVQLKRRILGPEHPDTVRSLNNLANMMALQGRLSEADVLAQETLELKRRVLGPEHRDTLMSMFNVAIIWYELGRLDDARKQFEETLSLYQRTLGPEYPDTLKVMNNLAELLLAQGHPAEAQRLLEKTLEIQRRILGPKHYDTLAVMTNLTDALRELDKLPEAAKLGEESLQLHRDTLGQEHPLTLAAMSSQAYVLRDQGRLAQAAKLYEEILQTQRRVQGPNHPDTLKAMNVLAWFLATVADPKFRDPTRAIEIAKHVVQQSPKAGDSWNTLGVAFYRAGQWKNSIDALEKSETLAPGRYLGINALCLAMAQWQLGDKESARASYLKAAEWIDKNKPADREAHRFLLEASQLLGIPGGKSPEK